MSELEHGVFDLVDRISEAETMSTALDAYLNAAKSVGMCWGSVFIVPKPGDAKITFLASSMPRGCQEGYVGNELFTGDKALSLLLAGNRSFEWSLSDWTLEDISPIERRWHDHCLIFGIKSGFCMLDFRPESARALMVYGGAGRLSARTHVGLRLAGAEVIRRSRELVIARACARKLLSQRERECLEWVAAGKTDWEIGQILSLSDRTVNVYVDRAKAKIGVKTRAQAIVMAAKQRAIAF